MRELFYGRGDCFDIVDRAMNRDEKAVWFHQQYGQILGACQSVFHIPEDQQLPGTPHVDIHIYRAPSGFPFHLLVTAGMSFVRQPSGAQYPKIELYLRLDAASTDADMIEVCRGLWGLAQYPFRSSTALGDFHLVHGMPPLVPESQLTAFMVTPPSTDRPMIRLAQALDIQCLHAYSLTEGERVIAQQAGYERMPAFASAIQKAVGPHTLPLRTPADLRNLL